MSVLQAAQLSCDVYKPRQTITRDYKRRGITIIEKDKHPIFLTLQDKSDLYIAFRGCKDVNEFIQCLDRKLVKPRYETDVKVNKAFWNTYEEIKDELGEIIANHDMNDVNRIIFTGHSKGGALAQIASTMLDMKDLQDKTKRCITFGAPYVGDKGFQEFIQMTTADHKRVVTQGDIIPLAKLHKDLVHNGEELKLETTITSTLNCIEHHSCKNYIDALIKYEQQRDEHERYNL